MRFSGFTPDFSIKVEIMKPSNYRDKDNMAYTRHNYMGGIPGSKIVRFTMGNTDKNFTHKVILVNTRSGQIRHNALEAARIAAFRHLETRLERKNFMLKIVPFPHQILREHKRVNVAQADRFQEGMKMAYGKPVSRAARLDKRDTLIYAEVEEDDVEVAKRALEKASNKLPLPTQMLVEELEAN